MTISLFVGYAREETYLLLDCLHLSLTLSWCDGSWDVFPSLSVFSSPDSFQTFLRGHYCLCEYSWLWDNHSLEETRHISSLTFRLIWSSL